MRLGLLMRRTVLDWTSQEDRERVLERHPKQGSGTLKKDGFGNCI